MPKILPKPTGIPRNSQFSKPMKTKMMRQKIGSCPTWGALILLITALWRLDAIEHKLDECLKIPSRTLGRPMIEISIVAKVVA
jgi:hypothetical protein